MVLWMAQLRRPFPHLSVLALSSRFDGRALESESPRDSQLSVLALSSRFDGPREARFAGKHDKLSVLALSSRFDGLGAYTCFLWVG